MVIKEKVNEVDKTDKEVKNLWKSCSQVDRVVSVESMWSISGVKQLQCRGIRVLVQTRLVFGCTL